LYISLREGIVAKTLVDIDEALLAQAQEALGTSTKKETINRARAEAVAASARRREIERLDRGVYTDLGDPEVMRQAWR